MRPTRIGNRVVFIRSTALGNEKAACPPPAPQRPATRRIVVIRNNELVGSGPRR